MSEFPYSLLQEFELLVESDKGKNVDTTTANTCVSGAYQDLGIRPLKRQRFDTTTTANTSSVSGSYQDLALRPPKKRGLKWQQIWAMENFFQQNSNPNMEQRQLLSKRIRLPTLDIQLWFQNRRSQPMIVDDLMPEIEKLQVEIKKLQVENKVIKQAICNITCQNCGDVAPSFVVSSSLLGSEG